ncbi:hypothetical protein [Methylosinus sp. H3A]|uniref:hypothetical protein n=1 Tax=Methylosinus sp. H3A TaxID=2785786 RepID=UPI001FF01854|nr:hypothetical protein [Methylosinus sp. H3A]
MLALLGDQHLVEPRQPLRRNFIRELRLKLDLALVAKFQRDELARPVTNAVSDIVAGDMEDAAVVEHTPDDDVGVGMAGVVMVDGNPVEARVEVLLHLPHKVAGEASQVGHVAGVLRRDDETELMTIVASALDKGAAVCLILDRRIGVAPLAVASDAIAFEIAEMGVEGLARGAAHLRTMRAALWIELHDARLDDDATRSKPSGGIAPPAAAVSRQRRRHLRASSPRVEPAASFSFPAVRQRRTSADPARIAARLLDSDRDLPDEGKRARTAAPSASSGPAGSNVEIVSVVARHSVTIGVEIGLHNRPQTPIAVGRENTGCSVEPAGHATSHLASAGVYHAANTDEFDSGGNRRTSRRIMPAHL